MEISLCSATILLKNSALKDKNRNKLNTDPYCKVNVDQDDIENSNHDRDILHLENANRTLQLLENAFNDG